MPHGLRVAVTGASGYLGSRLVAALAPHNRVVAVDLRPADDAPAGVDLRSGDLTRLDFASAALEGAEVIFHRAGLHGNVESMRRPLDYYHANVTATLHVLEAAVRHGTRRFVFDSTEMVFGPDGRSPLDEEQPPRPASMYGATKLICEHAVRMAAGRSALSTVILRYCRVRDADKQDVVTALARSVLESKPVTLVDEGRPVIDFVDVDDVVRANLRAAVSDLRDELLHIGPGEALSLQEILETIVDEAGLPAPTVSSVPLDRRPPDRELQFSALPLQLRIDRAAERLGWRPRTSMRRSIRDTVARLRDGGSS